MRDVDYIIERVKGQLATIVVEQLKVSHPADDDGLWFFSLPGVRKNIQIESSLGTCPFIVEHSDMKTTAIEALGVTVDSTVELIVHYLSRVSTEHSTN